MSDKKFAICIVSHDRDKELIYTLDKLKTINRFDECNVYVFLDGYLYDTTELKQKIIDVICFESKDKVGASKARKLIYEHIKEPYVIGFDDDSHPLDNNTLSIVENCFIHDRNMGIIAFAEIKGIFTDQELKSIYDKISILNPIMSNEFIGCGYAIMRDLYDITRGFPEWISIYGEESFLSFEMIKQGLNIIHIPQLVVHHRVNKNLRTYAGYNIFRFKRQLAHSIVFYYCYYPLQLMCYKMAKLLFHNFIKYAFKNPSYFYGYWSAIFMAIHIIMSKSSIKNTACVSVIKRYENANYAKLTY